MHCPADGMSFPIVSHGFALVGRRAKGDLPVERSLYGERDYAFGQLMLTLRTRMGLTQASLAKLLGISRRALGTWQQGRNYPATAHLKELIVLGRPLG